MKHLWLAVLIAVPCYGWTLSSNLLEGWQTKTLTIRVNPSHCSLSDEELFGVIDAALKTWNGVPNSQLTLVRSPELSTTTPEEIIQGVATDTPVIVCDPNFGANQNGDPEGVPAATRISGDSPMDYGGIFLNVQSGASDNIANLAQANINLLILTLAHETGHLLGLGHSSQPTALMYYSLDGKKEVALTQDDRDGITYLYPKNELFSGGAFGCSNAHRVGGEGASFLWFVVTLLLGAGGMALSRRLANVSLKPERLL